MSKIVYFDVTVCHCVCGREFLLGQECVCGRVISFTLGESRTLCRKEWTNEDDKAQVIEQMSHPSGNEYRRTL